MILISPLKVPVGKKFFILNINNYRNTHYQVLNKAKISYKALMQEQIKKVSKLDVIRIKYTLYPGTKRLMDVSNVLSIHDKFFADALVEYEKIKDDNYKFLIGSIYEFGCIDKDNPRVEIMIEEVNLIKRICLIFCDVRGFYGN